MVQVAATPIRVSARCLSRWLAFAKQDGVGQLKNYLVSQSSYHCNANNEYLGKSLAYYGLE